MPNKEYRYTKYFWLVNLNQAAYSKSQAEYFARLLEQAVLHVFTKGDVVAFAADGPRWNRNYIGNNMLQVHIEVGPKMSRVHAHVIQEIKHRTVLNIDQQDARDAINDYISERTGGRVDKCFVSKKIHPSAMPLEEYADKDNYDWKHSGESPTITSTYILKFGGRTDREEAEAEEDAQVDTFIASLQPYNVGGTSKVRAGVVDVPIKREDELEALANYLIKTGQIKQDPITGNWYRTQGMSKAASSVPIKPDPEALVYDPNRVKLEGKRRKSKSGKK